MLRRARPDPELLSLFEESGRNVQRACLLLRDLLSDYPEQSALARDILLFALAGGLPPITAYPDDGTRAKVQEMWSRMDLMPQAAPTARARA